ncbi:MAG TPA: E3 binding domain-containing protein, partial [Anaerolineae bacterium]|nr:E3 binding domain-containing protein [Anaerolineae bacterium]
MPIINIVIPEEIGPVEECVVVTWLKREGDRVEQGEDLLILQAEKTSFDIPAPATGTIKAVLVSQGETVKRDQPLAHLAVSETETVAAAAAEPEPESAVPPAAPGAGGRASPLAKKLARQHGLDLSRISGSGSGGRITERNVQAVTEAQTRQTSSVPQKEVLASPVAKRLAREHGLNLADLPTAGSGRITEKEVRAYLEAQQPVTAAPAPAESLTIPLTGMRGTIAGRM